MAEVVAIASFAVSTLALATEGLKIAEDLKTFVDRFNEASDDLTLLSSDVRLTSKTIEELGNSLKSPRSSQVVKEEWYVDTQTHVSGCTTVFGEIKTLLTQYQGNGSDTNVSLSKRQRLKFVWNHSKITRFRTRIHNLQNSFSFRLAVFQFSSNAIDRQTKAQEREQAKVLNQLRYEQALLGLQIAYVKMNEEDTVTNDQKDNTSYHLASEQELGPTISSPLCLPASPNGVAAIRASASTLVDSIGEPTDQWPRERRQTGPRSSHPEDHVPELVAEASARDDSTLGSDEASEDESDVQQAQSQVISPTGSKPSPERVVPTVMQEQLSTLTHLVQELTVRFDIRASRRVEGVENASRASDAQSVATPPSLMEAIHRERSPNESPESEKPGVNLETAHGATQLDAPVAEPGTYETTRAGSILCGIRDMPTIEATDSVYAGNGNEALKPPHAGDADEAYPRVEDTYEEDAHNEDAESGVLEEPAIQSRQGSSGRSNTGDAKHVQDGGNDDGTASLKASLQTSVDGAVLHTSRAASSQIPGLQKRSASSMASSRPPAVPAAPTSSSEASQQKVMVFDTGHRNGLLKSLKYKLSKTSGDKEDPRSARGGGPTFQRPSEPANGPLRERLEAWSIHCNETFRRLGQVDRAWSRARVQYMPVASDDLSKELVDRAPHQSLFDELADLPCSAREQVMGLLIKRWDFDVDLDLDDNQCGWTLAAIQKRPPDTSPKSIKALHVIIQRVWTPDNGGDVEYTTSATRSDQDVRYACWHLQTVDDNDWEKACRSEIPMRQSEMARMIKSQNGPIPYDLGDSGTCRAAQIEGLVQDQNARSDQHEWEIAYNKYTKTESRPFSAARPETMTIILERKPRQSKDDEQHQALNNKPRKTQKSKQDDIRSNSLYDPFGESVLFHRTGKPMDGHGAIEFSNAGLPPEIPKERPIGARSQAATKPGAAGMDASTGDSLADILGDGSKPTDHTTSKDSKGASTVHFGPDRYYSPSSSRRPRSRSRKRRDYDDVSDSNSSEDLYYDRNRHLSSRSRRRPKYSAYDDPYSTRRSGYDYSSSSRPSTYDFRNLGRPSMYDYPSLSRPSTYDYPNSSKPPTYEPPLVRRSTYEYPNVSRPSTTYDKLDTTSYARTPSVVRSTKSSAIPEESNKALSKILDEWMPMGSQAMDMVPDEHSQRRNDDIGSPFRPPPPPPPIRVSSPLDSPRIAPRYYDDYPNEGTSERPRPRLHYPSEVNEPLRSEGLDNAEREIRMREIRMDLSLLEDEKRRLKDERRTRR